MYIINGIACIILLLMYTVSLKRARF